MNSFCKRLFSVAGCVLVALAAAPPAAAQYYSTGEDPAWIKWRQIQSRHFNIIYPASLDSTAQRYAWLFDTLAGRVGSDAARRASTRLPKLPVVLHAYNVASNGVMAWAPSRMELITTPPLDGYPQAWDKQLVLHETRHVAQLRKTGSHGIRLLHGLIGEQAEGLAAGIFVPGWYLEGDATVSETAFSSSGRGRNAKFLMAQKAYITNGTRFKLDTWKNGSFRYLIPNEYVLGYRLAAYAHLTAGTTVFDRTLDYTTSHLLAIPPFHRGLKKTTGMNEKQLEAKSFAALQKIYARDDSLRGPDIPHRRVTARTNDYQAYRYPAVTAGHRIIAVQNTLNHTARLVEIDTAGKAHLLRHIGAINSHIHYNRGMIYWTEVVPDPRWPQQSYSVIKACDVRTREVYTLTRKTRFFGVSVNADGSMLVTVEHTPEGGSRLAAIPLNTQGRDARPCVPTHYVDAPPHQEWKHITWLAGAPGNQTRVAATLLTDAGLGLYDVNLESGAYVPLINDGFRDIKRLTTLRDYLVFESDGDGANNIYALKPDSGHVYRLTNARLGAFDPAFTPDGHTMVYANYHTYGYDIVKAAVDSLRWERSTLAQPLRYAWADSLSALFRFNADTLQAPRTFNYPSKPYRKFAHLFRFHSWAPVYVNPDGISDLSLERFANDVGLGVTLFSQNTLGTAVGRMGYKYANGFHSGHLEFTYKGWYPVIELNLDLNDRKAEQTALYIKENKLYTGTFPRNDLYVGASARLYIPFNFTGGGWQRGFVPQVDVHVTNDVYLTPVNSLYSSHYSSYYFRYLLGGVTWYNRLSMALRELYPRWGYLFKLLHMNPLSSGMNFGHITAVQLTTYSPGILPNHSLRLKAGYQQQRMQEKIYYLPMSLLSAPRGYQSAAFEKETVLGADYSFPLFYPHWNIGRMAYFKRIQMNLFYDHGLLADHLGDRQRTSAGFDFSLDGHFFRFAFPVSIGIRCAFPLAGHAQSPGRLSPAINFLFDVTFD
jgi:hypothetical protein